MAIWSPTQGAETNAGADGGTLFKSSANGSRVIQSKVTPANAQARAGFAQWGRLAYWEAAWLTVSQGTRNAWDAFSQGNPDYGLSGRAVIKSGADHFAAYFNRLELMSGTTPTAPFSTPAPSPSWTAPAAPFEEFLVGTPSFAMVLATTQPDPITLFIAVRQPSKGKGDMARSTQRPLGSYTFDTMTQGDYFTTACEDAEARFGSVAEYRKAQQWFTVWEAIGGYARPLLDPCWTPPLDPPPDAGCSTCSAAVDIHIEGYPTVYQPLGDHDFYGIPQEPGQCLWLYESAENTARVVKSGGRWYVRCSGSIEFDTWSASFEGRDGEECPVGAYANNVGTADIS